MNPDVHYKVIHIPSLSPERRLNIAENERLIGQPLEIFQGVTGKHVDRTALHLYDGRLTTRPYSTSKNYDGELGCYLSHLMLLKSIVGAVGAAIDGYTVVFEDDVIVASDFKQKLLQVLEFAPEFDMIFLGNLCENHGKHIGGMLHEIVLYGTHAYLVNHRAARKIYEQLLAFDCQIDKKYKRLFDEGLLKGAVVFPSIAHQQTSFSSSIDHIKTAMVFMTVRPDKALFDFAAGLLGQYDVFVCVEDGYRIPEHDKRIGLIMIDKEPLPRDKAVYYFCNENTGYDKIWMVEDNQGIQGILQTVEAICLLDKDHSYGYMSADLILPKIAAMRISKNVVLELKTYLTTRCDLWNLISQVLKSKGLTYIIE